MTIKTPEGRDARRYTVEVTMPSGEKLPSLHIDREAFTLTRADEVGREIGHEIGRLIERMLKA
jgi:hypothetical protein